MNKFLTIISMLCLLACSRKHIQTQDPQLSNHPSAVVTNDTPPIQKEINIPGVSSFDNSSWSIAVPFGFTREKVSEDQNVDLFLVDDINKRVIIVSKELVPVSLEEYAMLNVTELKNHDVNINSVTPTDLNGTNALLLDSSKDVLHMWIWLAIKNGVAYTVSCGGLDLTELKEIKDLCFDVSKSFRLK